MQRFALFCSAALVCAMLLCSAGCSGGGSGNSLAIRTASATVSPDGTLTFSASKPVSWSVAESGGGSITSNGVYTAPPISGTYHIVATSLATPAQQSVYTVTVTATPPANSFAAGPMADAAYNSQPYGANLVRWPAQGSSVLAYLVYRDTNYTTPIAVVQAPQNYFEDSAAPLPAPSDELESITVTIQIDPDTANLTEFNYNTTYDTSLAQLDNPNTTLGQTSFSITTRRVPLLAGQTSGYLIRTLYVEYKPNGLTDPLQMPSSYELMLSDLSSVSLRPMLTAPPALAVPADLTVPVDGVYNCQAVPGATSYLLQVSPDALFSPNNTISQMVTGLSASNAQATLALSQVASTFPSVTSTLIYWRMAARVDSPPLPFALSYPNEDGWVFSPPRSYLLPSSPPPAAQSATKRKK